MKKIKSTIALAFFAISLPAAAASYRIDSIVLDDASTIPSQIVLAHSLLETGRVYTDDDLDQSLFRVRQIPFVFAATYSIEKIPDAEGYRVVFTVLDERAFFYRADVEVAGDDDDVEGSGNGGIGGRFYVPGGALEATLGGFSASGSDTSQSVGLTYRGFGLFGTGTSAEFRISQELGDGSSPDPTLDLSFEIPLTLRQSIEGSVSRLGSERRFPRGPANELFTFDSEIYLARLAWAYDTRNDPIFSTAGARLSAGPELFRTTTKGPYFLDGVTEPIIDERVTEQTGLSLQGERYWTIGVRGAVLGRVSLTESTIEQRIPGSTSVSSDIDSRAGDLEVGYAHNFGASLDSGGLWRARLEVGGGWRFRRTESRGMSRTSDDPFGMAGVAFRHPWGTIRVNATYVAD